MLDSNTKKRIDDCRDILVGKLPDPKSQIDQITLALIYKFMDDMDQQSKDFGGVASFFTGGFEKHSWSSIMSSQIGANEMLKLYSEGIEKMSENENIQPLFRSIFKDAYLPYRDPETLKMFLKKIDEFSYGHSEMLGDAFEYLLSVMGSQGDAGQFRTPRHIIDFMIDITSPKKDETILDPACGTSGFLISAYKKIISDNTKDRPGDLLSSMEKKKLFGNVSGYDISPDMIRLSLANLFLHGFNEDNLKIFEYDTLTSLDRWNDYYDVILANPPFMTPKGGIRPHNRFSIKSNRAEVLFVNYIMEHLTPKGRAAIVVPEGIIFQSGNAYKDLRKSLIEKSLIGVISLPGGVFNPYSGVKTSILILDRELSQKTDKIFFVKVENDGYDLGAQRREIDRNDLPKIKEGVLEYSNNLKDGIDEEHPNLSYVSKELILNSSDTGLNFERYRVEEESISKFELIRLDDLVEILDSKRKPISKSNRSKGEIPYYGATGIVDYIDDFLFNEKLILVGEDGAKWGAGEKTAFLISGKSWVNNHAHVLRPKREVIIDELLIHLINIQDLNKYVTGITVPKLNQKNLKDILIPLPPLEIQKEIVKELEQYQKIIDGAKQVVDNYKPQIDIDESWEMKNLGDIFKTSSGGTPSKSNDDYYKNGTIPWLRSGEVSDGFIKSTQLKITEKALKNSSAKIFPIDSVLVAMYGATVGQVGILKIKSSTNQAVCSIIPNNNYLPEFIYYYLKQKKEELIGLSVGGAQPNISQGIIKSIQIPIISLESQNLIVEKLEEERKVIEGNKKLIDIYTQKIEDRINKIWES